MAGKGVNMVGPELLFTSNTLQYRKLMPVCDYFSALGICSFLHDGSWEGFELMMIIFLSPRWWLWWYMKESFWPFFVLISFFISWCVNRAFRLSRFRTFWLCTWKDSASIIVPTSDLSWTTGKKVYLLHSTGKIYFFIYLSVCWLFLLSLNFFSCEGNLCHFWKNGTI